MFIIGAPYALKSTNQRRFAGKDSKEVSFFLIEFDLSIFSPPVTDLTIAIPHSVRLSGRLLIFEILLIVCGLFVWSLFPRVLTLTHIERKCIAVVQR